MNLLYIIVKEWYKAHRMYTKELNLVDWGFMVLITCGNVLFFIM